MFKKTQIKQKTQNFSKLYGVKISTICSKFSGLNKVTLNSQIKVKTRYSKWARSQSKRTSFVDHIKWTMDDVMKLESIIGLREALYIQRIVLRWSEKRNNWEKIRVGDQIGVEKTKLKWRTGKWRRLTWWPTTATQTIIFTGEVSRPVMVYVALDAPARTE
jgi:hypothetical protein